MAYRCPHCRKYAVVKFKDRDNDVHVEAAAKGVLAGAGAAAAANGAGIVGGIALKVAGAKGFSMLLGVAAGPLGAGIGITAAALYAAFNVYAEKGFTKHFRCRKCGKIYIKK